MNRPAASPLPESLIARFVDLVGGSHALTDPADIAPHLVEQRGLYQGASRLLVKPADTQQVSAILKLASDTGTAIVPQGGNTGLTGGQIPDTSGHAILLSLARMNHIRDIDPVGNTMTVEAGCVLAQAQAQAETVDRLFPLSLGAQGSCQIGGNLSTNAGGTAVLAYGNMRQLCLGLEVVLPTGEIWNGLRRLKKDNTGYDLRDLFIGAEGTLGVITAAVLKLFARPKGRETVFAGLDSPQAALAVFEIAEAVAGPSLTGFELMPRIGIEFTTRHIARTRDPLAGIHPWYALIDISSAQSQGAARALIETIFDKADAKGLIRDAVIAESESQKADFWRLRESMSSAQKPEGGSIKHDISVPVAQVPAFLREADKAVLEKIPDARIVAFGHLGDGNIHYNISQPIGSDRQSFLARWQEISDIVHAIVLSHDGSIAAEHGIGQLKRDELARIRQPIEIDLMRRIKAAFDPVGIMNPGKII